jgi:hypothetical protein
VRTFPLINGIAATSPDAVLNVAPLGVPERLESIAIDRRGDLAVEVNAIVSISGSQTSVDQIYIYNPGAKGNEAASRVLLAPSCTFFGAVAFDAASNMYVATSKCNSQEKGYSVYAAGAKGVAAPIAFFPHASFIGSMTISRNVLYLSDGSVVSYSSPLTDPKREHIWCLPHGKNPKGSAWGFDASFGLDEASSRLFVPEQLHRLFRIGIYPLDRNRCPANQSVTEHLAVAGGFHPAGAGLAFYNGYLFVGDGNSGPIYEVPARSGPQKPVAQLNFDGSLAIGP